MINDSDERKERAFNIFNNQLDIYLKEKPELAKAFNYITKKYSLDIQSVYFTWIEGLKKIKKEGIILPEAHIIVSFCYHCYYLEQNKATISNFIQDFVNRTSKGCDLPHLLHDFSVAEIAYRYAKEKKTILTLIGKGGKDNTKKEVDFIINNGEENLKIEIKNPLGYINKPFVQGDDEMLLNNLFNEEFEKRIIPKLLNALSKDADMLIVDVTKTAIGLGMDVSYSFGLSTKHKNRMPELGKNKLGFYANFYPDYLGFSIDFGDYRNIFAKIQQQNREHSEDN